MASRTGVLLLVAALAVAGCGDDDTGGAGDGTSTSAVTSVDADAADEPGPAEGSTTTTTAPDAEAEDRPGGSDDDPEGSADDFVYVADLTGDGGTSGRAELHARAGGELCADVEVSWAGSTPTGAHVHRSADGTPVVDLGAPTATEGETATWDDVCVPVEGAVAEALAVDATAFHVDVHAGGPDAAATGQLGFATIFDLELS